MRREKPSGPVCQAPAKVLNEDSSIVLSQLCDHRQFFCSIHWWYEGDDKKNSKYLHELYSVGNVSLYQVS